MTQPALFATGTIPTPRKAGEIEPKSPEFYIKQWLPIPKKAVSMISAPGGAGKSFLAIQLACRVIEERPDTRRVLLWLSEDPAGQTRKRLDDVLSRIMKVGNAKEYLEGIDIIGSDSPTPHITIDNLKDFQTMTAGYSVVILDPLIAFYPGEENSNSEARAFMNMFTYSAQTNAQAIVFIHHHTKGNGETKSSTRGAGAFIDAVRVVYELEVIEGSRERKVIVAKDNWGVMAHFKSGKELTVLPFEVIVEEKGEQGKKEKEGGDGKAKKTRRLL